MSEENVEIIRRLQAPPGLDLSGLFARDDPDAAEHIISGLAPQFTDDFVCVFHNLSSEPRPGVAGFREAWLDWLDPWETYRTDIESVEALDDDRVRVLSRDFGRRPGMANEIELRGAAVWTLRDGLIARVEFFPDRDQALKSSAVGD